jgi:hypothetical protein
MTVIFVICMMILMNEDLCGYYPGESDIAIMLI